MKEKLRRRYGWWIESRDAPSFVPRRSILLGAATAGCHSWVEHGREAERAEVITGRDGRDSGPESQHEHRHAYLMVPKGRSARRVGAVSITRTD